MQIGVIGLGRMGGNISLRLMKHGHECVVFDQSADAVAKIAKDGAKGAKDLGDMIKQLAKPRAVWVMLPSGHITEQTIEALGGLLESGDTVIDGGNTFYKDDIRRAAKLREKGIVYVDVGTSGGVWGLERGYCMMIGGEKAAVDRLDPILSALAPGVGKVEPTVGRKADSDQRVVNGYMHCGAAGSGHFVKMVHNGIEYGIMQAYAEGLDIIENKNSSELPENERFDIDVANVAEVWRRGSVISSWLLDLTATALAENPTLENFRGDVADSGEGRWTVEAALEEGIPADVLSASLYARFRSRGNALFANKVLSAMRFKFGGHVEPK